MAVVGLCSIILDGTVLILLFFRSFSSGFPEQCVHAVEGDSIFLNCLVDNQTSVENSTVEWSKDGVKQRVHLYKHRKDQVDDQDKEFRGRTTLDHEGLKRGNVTLKLQPVHLSDSGRYSCYIPSLDYRRYINLIFVSNGQNNMTKGENSSTTGTPDEENQGRLNWRDVTAIVLSIIFLFLLGIIFLIKRRCEAMKSKMKRTDEENELQLLETNHQGASLSPSTSTPDSSINQASAPHLVTDTDTHG